MKKIFLFCALIGLSAALFARGAAEHSAINIGYPETISSIPLLELVERYPEDYTGSSFTDHPQAPGQLINGELDVLASGFTVGMTRFNAGHDIGMLDTFVWGVSAIMTAEPVQSLADLSGSTIFVPFEGSPIDLQIRAHLAAEGLQDSVNIAFAPFPQAAALLGQGEAQAAVLVEPIASRMELSGNAYRFMNIQDSYAVISGGESRSPQVSLFSRIEYYDSAQRDLDRLVERIEEIGREIQADPATYAAKYQEYFSLPVNIIQNSLENTFYDFAGASEDRDLIELYTEIMNVPVLTDEFFLQ